MTDTTEAPERIWATTAREGFDTIHSEWPGEEWPPADHPYDYPPTEYTRSDLTAAKDARIEDLEAENERLRDALERAEGLCRDRAERLNDYGLEMECCAATAKNCAEDVACTISELEESK